MNIREQYERIKERVNDAVGKSKKRLEYEKYLKETSADVSHLTKSQQPTTKKFTGKTEGFTDNRERHFYQRMLRAYLKGHTHFNFGFSLQKDGKTGLMVRMPDTYLVQYGYGFADINEGISPGN